jgi:hypothetical protein
MKPILCEILVLFALHPSVLADVPKIIFDDDTERATDQLRRSCGEEGKQR